MYDDIEGTDEEKARQRLFKLILRMARGIEDSQLIKEA